MKSIERECLPTFKKLYDTKEKLKSDNLKIHQSELLLNGSFNSANWLFNLGFRIKNFVLYKSTYHYSGCIKIVALKSTDADKMMNSYLTSTSRKPRIFQRNSSVFKQHSCCNYQVDFFGKQDEDILKDIYILLGIQSKSVNQDEILKLLDEMTTQEGMF